MLPGAEPFAADRGRVGVVLCHGFTGSPQGLRGWGEALAASGVSVRLPRLPGHGTTWQEMNRTTWDEWYGEVDAAFGELRERCSSVFVAGLSMGGALALRLAEQHGATSPGSCSSTPPCSCATRCCPPCRCSAGCCRRSRRSRATSRSRG